MFLEEHLSAWRWKMLLYQDVACLLVEKNPEQPRRTFSELELTTLAESIKKYGILQPLLVRPQPDGKRWWLVAGERRWRAAQKAGLTHVPIVVREEAVDSKESLLLAMVENVQRANLNPIEEALAYQALMEDHGVGQEEIARQVGRDRSSVSNYVRLLRLPAAMQDSLAEGKLTLAHGKLLLGIEDTKIREVIYRTILAKGLTVRQAQRALEKKKGAPQKGGALNSNLEYMAEGLRNALRTKVRLSGDGKRGKIEIAYFSPLELERIVGKLTVRS